MNKNKNQISQLMLYFTGLCLSQHAVSMTVNANTNPRYTKTTYMVESNQKVETVKHHPWKDMPVQPCPMFMAGPYVGIDFGLQENMTGTPTAWKGLGGNIYLGVGKLLGQQFWGQRFYLGGEVFGGVNDNIKDYRYAPTGVGVASDWYYGAALLPGVLVNDLALMYARVGVASTHFTDQSTNVAAWQVGGGLQTPAFRTVDVRLEYVYSQYESVTGIGVPQVSQFNLGLVKKFAML